MARRSPTSFRSPLAQCPNSALIEPMAYLRVVLFLLTLVPLSGCDSSCDDLEKKLCTGAKGGLDEDCKLIRVEERKDALVAATCASILKSMRE